jgi:hypothetical protein
MRERKQFTDNPAVAYSKSTKNNMQSGQKLKVSYTNIGVDYWPRCVHNIGYLQQEMFAIWGGKAIVAGLPKERIGDEAVLLYCSPTINQNMLSSPTEYQSNMAQVQHLVIQDCALTKKEIEGVQLIIQYAPNLSSVSYRISFCH